MTDDPAVKRDGDQELRADLPAGRILSAAEFAGLVAVQRNHRLGEKHIGNLPSLHEQAWRHGYRQGLSRVLSDLKSTLTELRTCHRDRDDWLRHFVFAVLRKVLGTTDAASLVPLIVKQVIEHCDREFERFVIHVHPEVAPVVTKRVATIAGKGLQICVVADDCLAKLQCEVYTPFGIVDASLDTQLDALENAVCSTDTVLSDD